MNNRLHRPTRLVASLALAAAGYVLAGAQAADVAPRTLAQPVAPPAIDRGLLVDDVPAEPRRRDDGVRVTRSDLDDSGRLMRGRVIVKFRSGEASARSSVRALGVDAVTRPSYANFDVLEIDPSLDPEAVAADLATHADVEYAQAAYVNRAYFRPNDPLYAQQWNLSSLGMEQAWDINNGASTSVVVAVLDTGIAYQNAIYEFTAPAQTINGVAVPALGRISVPFAAAPELAGANRFVAPHDFIWNDDAPVDTDGHGTHVAGTIGQLTNNSLGTAGMAFNVRLMPVKVIAGEWDAIFRSPMVGTDDTVARGIRYAADNGAQIINMSLGRDGPPAPVIGDAMRYAIGKGVFIAVAAGNDYENGNPIEVVAQQAGPLDGAIVVAAVGQDQRRAYYSGARSYVEIAAPGGNSRVGGAAGTILQQTYELASANTFPPARYGPPRFDVFAYRFSQGTSMATPHVAGLAALLYSQGIKNPAAVEAAIKYFATDLGTAGRDDEYGVGLINPRATLRGLGLLK